MILDDVARDADADYRHWLANEAPQPPTVTDVRDDDDLGMTRIGDALAEFWAGVDTITTHFEHTESDPS